MKKICLVSENDVGIITGVIAGTLSPHIFDPAERYAQEIIWFVGKSYHNGTTGLLLLKEFKGICRSLGAKKIVMKHMEDLNPIEMRNLYGHKKYQLMELHYVKQIA